MQIDQGRYKTRTMSKIFQYLVAGDGWSGVQFQVKSSLALHFQKLVMAKVQSRIVARNEELLVCLSTEIRRPEKRNSWATKMSCAC